VHFWQVSDGSILDSKRISIGSYAIDLTNDGYTLAVGSADSVSLLEIAP
jgi:hypothetical protein